MNEVALTKVIVAAVLVYFVVHTAFLVAHYTQPATSECSAPLKKRPLNIDLDRGCVLPAVAAAYPRLAPHLVDYCRLHRSIRTQTPGVERRLVVFKAHRQTGLGNRISSLTSSYLFAILSKRALVVKWGDEPREIYIPNPKRDEEVFGINFLRLFEYPGFVWDPRLVEYTEHADIPNLRGTEEYLTCAKLDEDPTPVLQIESWDYFLPLLAINPHHQAQLHAMFGEQLTRGLFKPLALNLIRPLNRLQREIDQFLAMHNNFVAVQVRTKGFFAMFTNNRVLEGVVNCTLQMIHDAKLDESTKWFLFTDLPHVREYFASYHGDRTIFYDRGITRLSIEGLEGAIIDLFIAREAKQVLVSHGSTFGKVIYGMSGVYPYATTNTQYCTKKDDAELCYWDGGISPHQVPLNARFTCLNTSLKEKPWVDRRDFNHLNGILCQLY